MSETLQTLAAYAFPISMFLLIYFYEIVPSRKWYKKQARRYQQGRYIPWFQKTPAIKSTYIESPLVSVTLELEEHEKLIRIKEASTGEELQLNWYPDIEAAQNDLIKMMRETADELNRLAENWSKK